MPGPGWGPGGPPPGSGGGGGKALLIIALVTVPLLLIGAVVALSGSDDDGSDTTAGISSSNDDDTDSGSSDDDFDSGTDFGDDDSFSDDITSTTLQPAEAVRNDCIAVYSDGTFQGTGSCADGGAPYKVVEVVDSTSYCADSENDYIYSGDYTLCLEVNLVLNHCYIIPEDGWITTPFACEDPGSVHVIDIVPGVDSDEYCTDDYEWNAWYQFESPHEVVCVMSY
jgi:hypothetical protein